ncbi:MAG: hypothetical protein M0P71_15645, partial [Melioribacteraceae bacterium]|nr:hypothetical protein [Melioribacteraceae bacterium]
ITLIYGGSTLSENQKNEIIKKANDFNIKDATISIQQGLTFSNIDDANIESLKLKEQIINLNDLLKKQNSEIDSIRNKQKFGIEILNEIKPLFQQINSCLYSESLDFSDSLKSPHIKPIVILYSNTIIRNSDKTKINNWLKQRLKSNNIKVYYEKKMRKE